MFVASQWHGILQGMSEQLRLAGVDPLIDPQQLLPAIVLTVDELLPVEFALDHKKVAVLGSSALVVQRFLNRKDIAAASAAGVKNDAKSNVVKGPWPEATASAPAPTMPSSVDPVAPVAPPHQPKIGPEELAAIKAAAERNAERFRTEIGLSDAMPEGEMY
jgi:hypothetical protein